MQLYLDSDFKPFSEKSIDYKKFTFSGGEPHIVINEDLSEVDEINISHRIRSFNDMGLLLLAINALRNMGVEKINLLLPYFPAARQDRIMRQGEALSVKVYADLINSLNLNSISIFDPHSDVSPALLNNCKVIDNHQFIKTVLQELKEDTLLISPDAGAFKKIDKLATYLHKDEIVACSKSRNPKTGKLSGFKVYADDLKGKDCLIVDDICDGGGTFLGLAKELKAKNAGKLYLAISHGICSKGFDNLSKEFEKIYTTDSFNTMENTEYFKQIKLKNIL